MRTRARHQTGGDGDGLRVHGVGLSFGGVRVLDDVSFEVPRGTVVGVIGPNGAGKTTLMNTITGVLRPERGEIAFGGRSIVALPAHERARLGIARTYQIVRPLRHLSTVENVMVGALYGRTRMTSLRKARELSMRLLARVGLEHRGDIAATSISSGQQKLMDLARALAMDPEVLLMDEPLAALSAENQELVLNAAREEAADGRGVVFIEHLVGAVAGIAERLVVLDRGKVIADGAAADVMERTDVLDAYLGASLPAALAPGELGGADL